MTAHPSAASQDMRSIRATTSAGEALSAELYRRWLELFGVPILDGLGTAEMWHVFLTNTIADTRPGSLGKAVPGFDVRVCDDDGRELPRGETGFLWVRGDSRAIAYWHEMDKTQDAFRGPWYASRDMVRQDEDGYFHYSGRDDDMLKVGGRWLAPAEVENRLQQHPNVAEVAVVGVPDAQGLVKPWAYVVAREGGDARGARGVCRGVARVRARGTRALQGPAAGGDPRRDAADASRQDRPREAAQGSKARRSTAPSLSADYPPRALRRSKSPRAWSRGSAARTRRAVPGCG
jgi:acyl-coenzyme A synthetase/AMP-(fatty) acid ligase